MICFCDIDGCIADASKRFLKAGEEPKSRGKKWSNWLRVVQNKKTLAADPAVPAMAELCWALHNQESIVYVTGRSVIYREVTLNWLDKQGFPVTTLLMRPKNNRMKNGALKEDLIKDFLRWTYGERTALVIDDDQNGDIEEMCKRNGFTFLKARSGGSK